jgi:hypothetical protein
MIQINRTILAAEIHSINILKLKMFTLLKVNSKITIK